MSFTTSKKSTVATPQPGYVSIYPKTDGKWYFKDESGTELPVGNANPVFAQGYASNLSNSAASHTSASYQAYLSMNASIPAAGRYKIKAHYKWAYSTTGRNFLSRLAISGSVNAQRDYTDRIAATTQQPPHDLEWLIDLPAGSIQIQLLYACQQAGDTATIYHGQIEFFRVA